MENKALS